MGRQFAHQIALPGVGVGVQVMRARALLVVAAGAVKSLCSSVSNHADKRGALRQEDELLCGA